MLNIVYWGFEVREQALVHMQVQSVQASRLRWSMLPSPPFGGGRSVPPASSATSPPSDWRF